jgi:hypothetical protein
LLDILEFVPTPSAIEFNLKGMRVWGLMKLHPSIPKEQLNAMFVRNQSGHRDLYKDHKRTPVEIDVGKSKVHRSLGMKIQPEMDFEIKLNCTSDYALGCSGILQASKQTCYSFLNFESFVTLGISSFWKGTSQANRHFCR